MSSHIESSYLDNLTQTQRAAAEHREGPMLILAGPGSGKTRVITTRIAHLLETGVHASQILALTFTNKAAKEMEQRIADMAPGRRVWVSTFHRFCSRLLREHAGLVGLSENFTIYDRAASTRALKQALEGLPNLDLGKTTPNRLLNGIGRCKQEMVTAEQYQPTSHSELAVLLSDVYPAYQQQLLTANAADFDDLLLHAVEILRQNETIRQQLDQRYEYIMVDEYQDTNLAQYAIVRALSVNCPNLVVTGDPDQSIYGWRGADIQNILGFERDYPSVAVVRLEQNFRSVPEILRGADRLIQYNKMRRRKSLVPTRPSGQPVSLLAFPGQQDEAHYIATQIGRLVASGERKYSDFAIFYRINALSRYLEHALAEHRIPYQVMNGVEFYQRKEVQDVLAYLQLINNPRDDVALLRCINLPARGLGKVSLRCISDIARQHRLCLLDAAQHALPHLTKRAANSLRRYLEMIDKLRQLATAPVEEILGHVLTETGYEKMVQDNDSRSDDDRHANIRELLTAARQFDQQHHGTDYLEAFLEQASLTSDTDKLEDATDKVSLMTLHASKGLEFPVVFLVAVEHGKLPHERSRHDPAQLEEERRLLFVGMTRAEDKLTLTYALSREFKGEHSPTVSSQFLGELPLDEMEVIQPSRSPNRPVQDEWAHDDSQLDDSWDLDRPEQDEVETDILTRISRMGDGQQDSDAPDADKAEGAEPFGYPPGVSSAADLLSADDANDSFGKGEDETKPDVDAEPEVTDSEATDSEAPIANPLAGIAEITTAAQLGRALCEPPSDEWEGNAAAIDPEVFTQGMRVVHPEHGLGKIVAISGSGKRRTATVAFVLAGRKSIVLSYSDLRPS